MLNCPLCVTCSWWFCITASNCLQQEDCSPFLHALLQQMLAHILKRVRMARKCTKYPWPQNQGCGGCAFPVTPLSKWTEKLTNEGWTDGHAGVSPRPNVCARTHAHTHTHNYNWKPIETQIREYTVYIYIYIYIPYILESNPNLIHTSFCRFLKRKKS